MSGAERNEATFFVLVRADGLDDVEFVQARKTKPELGLLRDVAHGERWLEVRAYVPRSVLMGVQRATDPCGLWADPIEASAATATTP